MRLYNTSTDYNNVCILASSGRVGSNFLMSTIRSDLSYHTMGEFFNSITWNLVIYSGIVGLMCREKSEHIFEFSDWLTKLNNFLKKNINNITTTSFCDGQLEMQDFDRIATINLYSSVVDFLNNKLHKNTAFKIFFSNTTYCQQPHCFLDKRTNFIDINNLLKYCNTLIMPYRKNVLLTYISDKKAYENNIYYIDSKGVNKNKLQECRDLKIKWDKKEYFNTFNYINKSNKVMFDIYKNFTGNKCIVNFEDLHKQEDKVSYLQNIYDKSNIGVKINLKTFNPTVKQSKDQPIKNNFSNPEEFLQDLPNIPVFLEYEY